MSKKKRKRDNSRRARRELSHKRGKVGRHYVAQLRAVLQGAGPYLRRNWSVVRAGLIFAACILVFMLAYSRLTESALFDGIVTLTARATASVLSLFDGDVQVSGIVVTSPGFTMGIIEACTGIVPMIIFVSAVLAYPSSVRQKAIGIALGILGIYAVNLVRTTTLFAVGAHFPGFFDTAHYLVWQSLMILAAVVFWLLWVMRLAHAAQE